MHAVHGLHRVSRDPPETDATRADPKPPSIVMHSLL